MPRTDVPRADPPRPGDQRAEPRRADVPAGDAPRADDQRAEPPRTETSRPDALPDHADSGRIGCTTPQLRRFIKSRAYVPMHELRRRFAINGPEDDVTLVETEAGHVFIGLPEREGRMIGDLLRQGEIGFELSLDPSTPVVVGVYPMRPVIRT